MSKEILIPPKVEIKVLKPITSIELCAPNIAQDKSSIPKDMAIMLKGTYLTLTDAFKSLRHKSAPSATLHVKMASK